MSNKPFDAPPLPAGLPPEVEERMRTLEMLLSVSTRISAIETLDEVLEVLVGLATSETGAERGSLFLNDPASGELYSRIALGTGRREIRILNTVGVAGYVYTAGRGMIIPDAYADPHFDRSVDKQTGFVTRNILCAPIRTARGEIIGVIQTLNKKAGTFTAVDLQLLEAMTLQAAITLQSRQYIESMKASRAQEMEFLDVVSEVSSEIELKPLLQRVMEEAKRMLKADRATLFLNDEKTNELWSEVGTGLATTQIRFPNHLGIAGAVFNSGKTVNIPYAYADLRFNPAVDKRTGYFTRSILCVPVVNKLGKCIGVTQVLNKHGGTFTSEDETRLKAFSAKISLGLENAKLFADIQNMKNYNESMLESMSNGVITLNEHGKIVTCNAAGLRILEVDPKKILGTLAADFFTGPNAWVLQKIAHVEQTQASDSSLDAGLEFGTRKLSVNFTVLPLVGGDHRRLGTMLMLEDISSEKRVKSTMARYMDPAVADQLLAGGTDLLGGKSALVTVLFSDLRGFTSLTEDLGAQGTVSLLNEYFTIMVECIQREGGMLDKFIGDAIMAAFGIPVPHPDDEDRALRAAIAMITELAVFNQGRAADGKKPLKMGVGLNTDMVITGNIGSPKRMDYTVIGDGVNLASRLESACKQYHAQIIISENTFKKLRGTYRIRDIDRVVVKGKSQSVGVYEVLDFHNEETFPHLMQVVGHFNEGMARYRQREWDRATKAFEEAARLNPTDQLSHDYLERCALMKTDPPADDWDGVWVLKSK